MIRFIYLLSLWFCRTPESFTDMTAANIMVGRKRENTRPLTGFELSVAGEEASVSWTRTGSDCIGERLQGNCTAKER